MSLPSPIELIDYVSERLGNLCDRVTFLGGAVVALLVTEAGVRPPRGTKDVDVAVELTSRIEFYDLEQALRERGFQNAIEGPICRFYHGPAVLDVMPTDQEILGFSNPWYPTAIRTASKYRLGNGITINLINPPCFLATKLEAFGSHAREDHGDMVMSRDFEDVVTLIDGRPSLVEEVLGADPDVREFIQECFRRLMNGSDFEFGVDAHLDQGRIEEVFARIEAFVNPREA